MDDIILLKTSELKAMLRDVLREEVRNILEPASWQAMYGEYVSRSVAARLLGRSVASIDRYLRDNLIRHHRDAAGSVLISTEDLHRFYQGR